MGLIHRRVRGSRSGLVALSFVGVLLVAGCGGSNEAGNRGETRSGAAIDVGTGKVTPANRRIAFMIDAPNTFSFPLAIEKGAKTAAREKGAEVDIIFSNFDQSLELSNFNRVFTSGTYGGLAIHAISPQLCKSIEQGAVQRKILVLVITNPLCGQDTATGEALWSPGTMSFVGGQNNVDGIAKVLEAAATDLGTGPKNVMFVMGPDGHPSTVGWEFAFEQFQKTHPDWKLTRKVFTDFSTPDAFAKTQNALQADSKVDAIFTLYIDVSVGVTKALDAQKLKIPLYENGGGSKVSVDLIKSGKLTGSLPVYPYSTGYAAVTTIVDAFNGVQPPKFISGDGNPKAASQGVVNGRNVDSFVPEW